MGKMNEPKFTWKTTIKLRQVLQINISNLSSFASVLPSFSQLFLSSIDVVDSFSHLVFNPVNYLSLQHT